MSRTWPEQAPLFLLASGKARLWLSDGGPATSARLASPVDVAIDSSGNIYISSHGNHAIRKVDGATGLITTVAGTLGSPGSTGDGGLATSAELNNLYSVAVDSSGNIYIADTGNRAIRKVDAATGVINTIAGILGSHGTTGDGGLATGALLGAPIGVALDSSGNIYIAELDNHVIRKVDAATGIISTVAGTLGTPGSAGDGGPATSAKLDHPIDVAVDSLRNIYIVDFYNHVIRKVDHATGVMSTVAGTIGAIGSTGDGGPATSAKLDQPTGIAVDLSGNVYITDHDNHAIRKVDVVTGIISTVVGTLGTSGATGDGGPATSANLNNPYDVAVDSLGNIYIADAHNHAIRKVEAPLGVPVNVPSTSAWGLAALAATLLVMSAILLRRTSGRRPAARP